MTDATTAVNFCKWLKGYFEGHSGRDELTAFEANSIRAKFYGEVYPPPPIDDTRITINGKTLNAGQNETLRTALLSFCYQLQNQAFRDALGTQRAIQCQLHLDEIISLIDEVDA